MAKEINPSDIPSGKRAVKETKTEKIELKNVLFDGGQCDITVEVIPFDRYKDEHVEFAYAYSDMLFRAPSEFKNVSEASRAYVRTFMVRKKDDETDASSNFSKVVGDLRACRTMFHQPNIMQALNDFFGGA